ncbi:MAG TPA: heterodisulfide reductase [Firmicutes bacterium]|jgi:heterodisulfide reductase subunit C|nr:heterodisulfide reductase [Bacillota bacterium]
MSAPAEYLREEELDHNLIYEVASFPGGHKIFSCQQCGSCSGSCDMAQDMDYTPRKMIEMIRAGMRKEVLGANAQWLCTTCYYCTVRCPRGIEPTEVLYAVKSIGIRDRGVDPNNDSPKFYETFCDTVHKFGRQHEPTLMAIYAFKGNPLRLMGFAPLGIGMLAKGKLGLAPSRVKNVDEVRKLIDRYRNKV